MSRSPRILTGQRIGRSTVRHIPMRFLLAMFFVVLETAAAIAAVILLSRYVPYFYILVWAMEVVCVLRIVNSNDNPDYKVPWLLFVLVVPVAGFMIYFMFYSRQLTRKQKARVGEIMNAQPHKDDSAALEKLKSLSVLAAGQASVLRKAAGSHLYENAPIRYFPSGEQMFAAMLDDLEKAQKFIFLEFFILEPGIFWNSVLSILRKKVSQGVEVRVIYDDIGCMLKLPGDYDKTLRSYGIQALPFSKLRGHANSEFNNRSHRKILVIDGKCAYTGGINLADEYINKRALFGMWKDVGVRLEGEAVNEMTALFLSNYALNAEEPDYNFAPYYVAQNNVPAEGFVIPYGDGPSPLYSHRVSKTMLLYMLNQAEHDVCMMSPYVIIDNELCSAMENCVLRGVRLRLITPCVPDKRLIFLITRSFFPRLIDAGVEVYEYTPGFIHAKAYLADGRCGIVGTANLDYRSLVHHFENGVWMCGHEVLQSVQQDFESTLSQCRLVRREDLKDDLTSRIQRTLIKIFSPLL